jgi:ABC-type amino acid transport substrate-binding protein
LLLSILHRTEDFEPEDKSSGTKLQNGSWTGVMGLLQKREVDMGFAYMIMTTERMEAVDFMAPILSSR